MNTAASLRLLAAFILLTGTTSALAQQPLPTDAWTVESVEDYDEVRENMSLKLKRRSDGSFKLDVKDSWFHELQRGKFAAVPACRIKLMDAKDLATRKTMIAYFEASRDTTKCPDSSEQDSYYFARMKISGHKHINEPDHDHLVVLYRACVPVERDSCARTHFVMLLLNAQTPPKSADFGLEALRHNGLIHGPQ